MRIKRSTIFEVILFHLFLTVYYFTFPQKDAWGPAAFLLLIVAALVWLEYRRTKLFVSPLLFWYVFWLAVIVIGRMDLDLYPFYQTWGEDLLKLVLLNTAVFFWLFWAGSALGTRFRYGKRAGTEAIYSERLTDITLCLLILAVLAFIVNVASTGVLPQLTGDANSYRQSFIETRYYRIVNFLRFTFALVPMAWSASKDRTKKMLLACLTLLLLMEEMLSGWRSFTMQAMILFLTSLLLVMGRQRKKQKRGTFGIIAAASVLALVFIGYIAVTRDGVSGALSEKLQYLEYTLYMYIAPNFLNLQSGMQNVEPLGRLMYSGEAVMSFFVNFEELPVIDQSIEAFNVSTYLLDPWADFGWSGTVLWTAAISGLSGTILEVSLQSKKCFPTVLLGICNCVIFLMHNNFFLRATSVLVWIVLSAGISIFITGYKKEAKPNGKTFLQNQYSL